MPEAQLSDAHVIEVPDPPGDPAAVARLLATGDVEVKGRMPWSSNGTFLVEARSCDGEGRCLAVYKPERGERPLWDFPPGLWRREVAAHRVAAALGWDLVPVTVPRRDAPFGEGSLQQFIPFDPDAHYFTLYEDPARHDVLRRLAILDLIINSTDRKGGHVLLSRDGHVWAIDNGLAFHAEPHLRTVIWEFAGEPVPEHLVADVARVASAGVDGSSDLLAPGEVTALTRRAATVASVAHFPDPGPSRRAYPWPLV